MLELIEGWSDPNPPPVLEVYDGITVVRDDLLEGGSKVRFIDYLIRNSPTKEFVYGGCPATGYAQMCLPIVTGKYGKMATLFMAERSILKLHPYQRLALEFGANIKWVPNGMLNVTLARARQYYEQDTTNRYLLPLGLEHPTVLASIVKVARSLKVEPTEIWCVGSSGTLTRGLQMAFPDVPAFVVQVGHHMTLRESGRAKVIISDLPFNKPVRDKDMPPFPSAPTYDAKGWKYVKQFAKKGALFWNVGA